MGDKYPSATSEPDHSGISDPQEASVPSDVPHELACADFIQLSLDESAGLVRAHLRASDASETISLTGVRAQLEAEGYGDWYASDAGLESVVQYAKAGKAGEFVLAERRDAKLEWRVSEDKQAVYLTLHRAWGGRTVTRELLLKALARLSVPEVCVNLSALENALAKGETENQKVAQAVPPLHGEDTRFEALVELSEQRTLVEDEKGRVDLHQLHDFLVVEPGTPLMRRIEATAGEAGVNVVGEALPPQPGADLPYAKDCEGAELDPEDASVLVATIKGHPRLIPNGIQVDPTLKVKNIDLSTGNIEFDGSVEVAGDVTRGFCLKATGDVVVRGMVERAEVYAGKDLVIHGGIAGEDERQDDQSEPVLRTRIRAGHHLSAKFINLAQVFAGGDLAVREYALQSQLQAGRDLLLGQPGGKGSLMGGVAKAGRALVANSLGSEANVATEIVVGKEARKRRLMNSLHQELERCEGNREKLARTFKAATEGKASGFSQAKLARIQSTLEALSQRQQRIQALIKRVAARQRARTEARVEVKFQLHANVSIAIDGARHTYNEDQGPAHLVRVGTEVVNHP